MAKTPEAGRILITNAVQMSLTRNTRKPLDVIEKY